MQSNLQKAILAALSIFVLPWSNEALAAGIRGHFFLGTGYRHSLTHSAGGMDFRLGLGAGLGRFWLMYEGEYSADHFKKEDRLAARANNWLDLGAELPLVGPLALAVGVGPGLGWIKPPGKREEPSRHPSAGLHETVQLRLYVPGEPLMVSLRLEPQHLWQDQVLAGPDHALAVSLTLGMAPGK